MSENTGRLSVFDICMVVFFVSIARFSLHAGGSLLCTPDSWRVRRCSGAFVCDHDHPAVRTVQAAPSWLVGGTRELYGVVEWIPKRCSL